MAKAFSKGRQALRARWVRASTPGCRAACELRASAVGRNRYCAACVCCRSGMSGDAHALVQDAHDGDVVNGGAINDNMRADQICQVR